MTETEWLDTDRFWLLGEYLREHERATRTKVGRRKIQLFNCASLRELFWEKLDENSQHLVHAFERFSDGEIDKDELDKARAETLTSNDAGMMVHYAMGEYAHGIYGYIRSLHLYQQLSADNARQQCEILRDIFGNPFRPVPTPDAAWRRWHDATIPRLAQQIYDSRDFASLPILADALEEAGCTNSDILEHCRGRVPHVRGCWAVDLMLGKG